VPLLLLFVLLVVIAVVAVVSTGRGDALPDAPPDRSPWGRLPTGAVARDDIDELRFSLAFRGYRMDEVDDVLDRLSAELSDRDEQLAWYRQRYGPARPDRAERPSGHSPGPEHERPSWPSPGPQHEG
jgi:DivIVA domain-containing protein